MRFPRIHTRRTSTQGRHDGPPCEGAIINTGGGMAGGDRLSIAVEMRELTNVVLTTPAAERVYLSGGANTEVEITLRLEAGSRLSWLPQESILFSGARLARRLDVEMNGAATLVLAEATIFGRIAMGEVPGRGLFADRWRIRRDGHLLHAEETRLDGPIAELMARPAIGNGARAVATVLVVSPEAEDRLDAVRAALEGSAGECGASARNGMLIARFLAKEPGDLRADLVRFLLVASQDGLPRLWAASTVERTAPSMPDWENAKGQGDLR